MAAASGEIMSSRRKKYMVQKESVIINSIGKMIEVKCMWSATRENLSVSPVTFGLFLLWPFCRMVQSSPKVMSPMVIRAVIMVRN